MGDRQKRALRIQFDGKLRLEFDGAKITSDAGLLPFRELDEAFRLTEKGSTVLSDPRHRNNTQHTMLALLRQGVYGRLAGYEDVNDAERLRVDPAMRRVVGGRAKGKEAASTSEHADRIHGERDRSRLDRAASCGRMMIESSANGKCRLSWLLGLSHWISVPAHVALLSC